MEFDFKITTWERVTVPKEKEKEVLEAIKNGKVTCANDIFNEEFGIDAECIPLAEVNEQMTLQENGGCSTIEVINDSGETIFRNGKE